MCFSAMRKKLGKNYKNTRKVGGFHGRKKVGTLLVETEVIELIIIE